MNIMSTVNVNTARRPRTLPVVRGIQHRAHRRPTGHLGPGRQRRVRPETRDDHASPEGPLIHGREQTMRARDRDPWPALLCPTDHFNSLIVPGHPD
jgi:hypothetical protein